MTYDHLPIVSLISPTHPQNRNLPVHRPHISPILSFASFVFDLPSSPSTCGYPAGVDSIASSMPSVSMARRDDSADHGKFSGGVRKPRDWESACLKIV